MLEASLLRGFDDASESAALAGPSWCSKSAQVALLARLGSGNRKDILRSTIAVLPGTSFPNAGQSVGWLGKGET
jgi:hypothetical protein